MPDRHSPYTLNDFSARIISMYARSGFAGQPCVPARGRRSGEEAAKLRSGDRGEALLIEGKAIAVAQAFRAPSSRRPTGFFSGGTPSGRLRRETGLRTGGMPRLGSEKI